MNETLQLTLIRSYRFFHYYTVPIRMFPKILYETYPHFIEALLLSMKI